MSWDVYLKNINGNTVSVERFEEDGTRVLGGITNACLNITYNYSWFYHIYIDTELGLKWLSGKTGRECVDKLESAVRKLGTDQCGNYWVPTPGNAGYALSILLKWSQDNPDAVFEVL